MKIYRIGYSWFYEKEEVHYYIGFFQKKENAEKAIKEYEEPNKTGQKRKYFIDEIEVN